jgi:hypothetical protein
MANLDEATLEKYRAQKEALKQQQAEDDRLISPLAAAGLTGAGVAGAYTGVDALRQANVEQLEEAAKDVILTRMNSKDAERIYTKVPKFLQGLMGADRFYWPINQQDRAVLGGGSIMPHGTLAVSPKKYLEIGYKRRGILRNLQTMLDEPDVRVYRPQGALAEQIPEAVEWGKNVATKSTYPREGPLMAQSAKNMLFGLAPKACRNFHGNLVCTESFTHAYPSEFSSALASPEEVRRNPNFKLVARYNPGSSVVTGKEKALARGVSPFVRSLKWALPAAGLVGLGTAMM